MDSEAAWFIAGFGFWCVCSYWLFGRRMFLLFVVAGAGFCPEVCFAQAQGGAPTLFGKYWRDSTWYGGASSTMSGYYPIGTWTQVNAATSISTNVPFQMPLTEFWNPDTEERYYMGSMLLGLGGAPAFTKQAVVRVWPGTYGEPRMEVWTDGVYEGEIFAGQPTNGAMDTTVTDGIYLFISTSATSWVQAPFLSDQGPTSAGITQVGHIGLMNWDIVKPSTQPTTQASDDPTTQPASQPTDRDWMGDLAGKMGTEDGGVLGRVKDKVESTSRADETLLGSGVSDFSADLDAVGSVSAAQGALTEFLHDATTGYTPTGTIHNQMGFDDSYHVAWKALDGYAWAVAEFPMVFALVRWFTAVSLVVVVCWFCLRKIAWALGMRNPEEVEPPLAMG